MTRNETTGRWPRRIVSTSAVIESFEPKKDEDCHKSGGYEEEVLGHDEIEAGVISQH